MLSRMKLVSAVFLAALSMTAAAARPNLEEVRNEMGIRSSDEVRGQRDAVGYATKADAMAKVWELSAQGPMPDSFGAKLEPGVIGVIGPHDDYIYAARTYREIFPLVTAKTVVIVGVFHRYRRFEARDQLVFDTYRAWSAPDGEIAAPRALRVFLLAKPGAERAQERQGLAELLRREAVAQAFHLGP